MYNRPILFLYRVSYKYNNVTLTLTEIVLHLYNLVYFISFLQMSMSSNVQKRRFCEYQCQHVVFPAAALSPTVHLILMNCSRWNVLKFLLWSATPLLYQDICYFNFYGDAWTVLPISLLHCLRTLTFNIACRQVRVFNRCLWFIKQTWKTMFKPLTITYEV